MDFPINEIKTKGMVDALFSLRNDARSKIFLIVLDAKEKKEEINMTAIHKRLKEYNIHQTLISCAENIRRLQAVGVVRLSRKNRSPGRPTFVWPTEKAYRIKNLLYSIKETFT